MDAILLRKLPKKYHKYIEDIYKEGKRYSVVIKFEDGFSRSIGDTNFSYLKSYVKEIIEVNRYTEW